MPPVHLCDGETTSLVGLLAFLARACTSLPFLRDVRYWHKADIPTGSTDVCFWG